MTTAITDPRPAATLRDFDGLTPLAVAQAALLTTLPPVAPVLRPPHGALGRVVGETVRSPSTHPSRRTALRDGYLVASRDTVGATPYAPASIAGRLDAVHAGDAVTDGCDGVLPPDAVTLSGAGAEVLQAVAPGSNTRETGDDLARGGVIVEAGARLRPQDLAVLALAGVETVALRIPCLNIEGSGALVRMIADLATAAGYDVCPNIEADVAVVLCAPGYTASAAAVGRFAAEGTRIAHGLAVRPGDAIGLCTAMRADGRARPVVIVPDRLADVLTAWLLIIEPCLARFAAVTAPPKSEALPLSGKIVSAPGMADLVLLRRTASSDPTWEPIATGDLTWSAFTKAEAYCLVPPEREGFAAGTLVTGVHI